MTELTALDLEDDELSRLRSRVHDLTEELAEIRDLARTGLPPEFTYPTREAWLDHKCNSIARMADKAIKGDNHA